MSFPSLPQSEPNLEQALCFAPFYQERIWGGRRLETQLGKSLPVGKAIGESWECVDRPEAQSLVQSGAALGVSLNQLWSEHREAVFGLQSRSAGSFPILFKLLDATEVLSVQVHPSGGEHQAGLGEPKNEWWYILDAEPGAVVYAGFREGATRPEIEAAISAGTLETFLHRIPVKKGDSLYVPGGRCHAIGAGCLIAEVQQNSDTTFRLYDWNRTDSSGRGRELHLAESMACMRWKDFEPRLEPPLRDKPFECEFFSVSFISLTRAQRPPHSDGALFLVISGGVLVGESLFSQGQSFILPAKASALDLKPASGSADLLQINLPL